MAYIIYILRLYLVLTFLLSLVSLPMAMAERTFYNILKSKPWSYIPFLCFYPFFTIVKREFKLFGLIKIKSRKVVAIYYLISSVILALLCIWGKGMINATAFTGSGPITLYANIHFISLIVFIVQFIIFRTKAYFDLFMVCEMEDVSLPLALLSVLFPLVLPVIIHYLEKNGRLGLLNKTSPATNQIS